MFWLTLLLSAVGFIALLALALLAALGLLVVICCIRDPKDGVTDGSNIFNRFRLVWFAMTRQKMFVGLCPWLLKDELENVTKK